jgi:hypothetical protein
MTFQVGEVVKFRYTSKDKKTGEVRTKDRHVQVESVWDGNLRGFDALADHPIGGYRTFTISKMQLDTKMYKDLGYANSWYPPVHYPNGFDNPPVKQPDKVPAEYKACMAAGHTPVGKKIGNCLTYEHCPICKIGWTIDSSG